MLQCCNTGRWQNGYENTWTFLSKTAKLKMDYRWADGKLLLYITENVYNLCQSSQVAWFWLSASVLNWLPSKVEPLLVNLHWMGLYLPAT